MIHFIFVIAILSGANLTMAQAAAAECKPEEVRSSPAQYYSTSPKSGAWISLTPRAQMFFEGLGMKARPAPTGTRIRNLGQCSPRKQAPKVYGTSEVTYFARYACEARYARDLAIKPKTLENYGSMEAGLSLTAEDFEVCTDGTKLLPCAALASTEQLRQSADCLRRAFP